MSKELYLKDFSDKPEELIGKKVLITTSGSKSIRKIERITSAYFYVNGGEAFNIKTGRAKGDSKWYEAWAYLITDERAKELSEEWHNTKLRRELSIEVANSANGLSLDQLRRIKAIIDETNQTT